jgi:hypothetical protein
VTAGLHYDLFHNTFVMVEGSKRFTLLAPAAINVAHLHPSLHPGYRQSQWVNVTAEVEALADTLPLWQITLSAGDGGWGRGRKGERKFSIVGLQSSTCRRCGCTM